MRINKQNNLNFSSNASLIKNFKRAAGEGFAKIDDIGEGVNITLDFLGKAVLVPATIMLVSKEEKEKKEYSALKNPVAATLQLLMEVPILMYGSKLIEKLANKGKLDKEGSIFSYNEKAAKEGFTTALQEAAKKDETLKTKSVELIERLNKKGLNSNLKDAFQDSFEKLPEETSKALKKSLENYDTTHKRLYHLQNRVCFVAAIVLTPLLCAAEDFLFPKVMKLLKGEKTPPKGQSRVQISLQNFKSQVAKGDLKC